jgi:hypothetical protein
MSSRSAYILTIASHTSKERFPQKHTKRNLLGSKLWGGLHMMDIYVYQGSGNIIQMICACQSKGKINQLFKITYLRWRYETGTQSCPLSTPTKHLHLDYVNSKWKNGIYQFITTFDIQIHTNIDSPSTLRENDKFIMDMAHEQGLSLKILR